jgi:glycosyltransferase involved in cell wall biosynthesis
MRISVMIPTLRRPADLKRCLDALSQLERRPDQVVVVMHREDEETADFLALYPRDALALEISYTAHGGQVGALNSGLCSATGDVIAILDDDTAPFPDWLTRIERHFLQRPSLGGLGGRDILHTEGAADEEETELVGRILWYGRWIGRAHRGYGPPREVEILKGCNMSYRREAIAGIWFDVRLRGSGAQWFNDAAFSMKVHRAGWDICYDPAVLVDHFHGTRQDGDDRVSHMPSEVYDLAFNETLPLMEYLPSFRRTLFLLFGFAVGHSRVPGLLQWIRLGLSGRGHGLDYQVAAWKGRIDAMRTFRHDRHPPTAGFDERQSLSPS